MPISEKLLEILVCPRTKTAVEMLSPEKLAALNTRIAAGGVKHEDGSPVEQPLEEALITVDGTTVYRIDDGIPVMLIERGIPFGS